MNEVFKKKYLKYSPEITLEIFTLVWNRLIELGYKHYCNFPIDVAYDEFKGNYEYFRTTEDHPNEFNCYSNEDNYKKITVEEILGYDPFIKNDFILPERWCIKTEKSTEYELIGKWFDSQSSNHCYKSHCLGEYYHSHNYSKENILNKSRMGASFSYIQILSGFTEITFDQFKKYVLKETIIPENIKTGKDWSKATEEELLEEAKRRYPIGCKVKLIRGNSGGDFGSEVRFTKHKFYDTSKGKQLFVDCNLLLFYETWVEIESLPETKVESKDWSKASEEELLEEAKRRYPIGCIFKSFTDNGMIREVIPYNVKRDNTITFSFRSGRIQFENGISTKGGGCSNPYSFENGNWAEIISLPETKIESKEVIPEYVECIEGENTSSFDIVGKIYKVDDYDLINGELTILNETISNIFFEKKSFINLTDYKPSTKEAFDAQFKPKSIEKWSIGSYVVCIKKYAEKFKVGDIGIIEGANYNFIDISKSIGHSCLPYTENCKWFATKSEAEEFAKTLVEPIKNFIECETCYGEGRVMTAKLYPTGHTEVAETCPDCNGNGFIDKPKQPLKQAVHCKTQEEWDFVLSKLPKSCLLYKQNDKFEEYNNDYKHENGIAVHVEDCAYCGIGWYKNEGYQILSFQEWCNLNEYKMEKEVKFEVGKWYSMKTAYSWIIKYEGTIDGRIKADWYCENTPGKKVNKDGNWATKPTDIKELSLKEIQQYLPDGHPDKLTYKDFKVGDYVVITKSSKNWTSEMDVEIGKVVQITDISDTSYINYEGKPFWSFGARDRHFRHATLVEINNHLLSIGQITVDEPLNNYSMDKKKYSIKELETNYKLLIYINSKEEYNKIEKVSKKICSYYGNYCYSLYDKTYSSTSSKSCLGSYDGDSIILTINDIIFEDKEIPNESYIGKYVSFNYNNRFYDKAFITEENGYIYVLNNCYLNNDGHKDKSKYKYSLKFDSIEVMLRFCKDIKFLDFESPKFKPLQPDDLLTWEIAENPNKIEFNYLPEPK